MKKILILCLIAASIASIAGPTSPLAAHRPGFSHPMHRPGPFRPMPVHHHCHHPYASPWLGFAVGTALRTVIANSASQTVVVQQPVATVVQQPIQIWVPAHYEDQLQANGVIVKVFVPGHWEAR